MKTIDSNGARVAYAPVSDEIVKALGRDTEFARGLPNEAFTSQAFLDLENQSVFSRSWVFAGPASDLPDRGDVKPVEVAGRSLFMARGQDDEIRVFQNVCPHRGTRLVTEEMRRTSVLTCPYHLSVLDTLEDDTAADPVGPVPGYLDLGSVMKLGLSVAVLRVAEGSRGTHADDPDHVLGRFRAGIDPRFDTAAPHAWQVVGAERRVGTDSPVVVDRDVVSGVLVELIRHAIGRVLVGEADRHMGPIAERLLLRGTAPAEHDGRARCNRITAGVPKAQ